MPKAEDHKVLVAVEDLNCKNTMTELIQHKQYKQQSGIVFHLLLWGVILILPNLVVSTDRFFNWTFFIRWLPENLGYMFVFYLNYFLLIDKFLHKGKTKQFVLYNLLIIVAVAFLVHYGRGWIESILPEITSQQRGGGEVVREGARGGGEVVREGARGDGEVVRGGARGGGEVVRRGGGRGGGWQPWQPLIWWFIVRNATMLVLMTGFSVAIKTTVRWFEVDNERKELAKAKMEAELQNLKNQINPHFLLNTLNNIYALIEFNPPKAQQAVLDLSKMLRHLLYDNNKMYVPLQQEVNLMQNYIDLMRIRLPEHVKLSTDFVISETSGTLVSPLIFISLIENAFKHGVSGDKSSFIDISLKERTDGKLEFISRNSYYPKSESDKSGSGIGLELVRKRLELVYPSKYTWITEIEEDVYFTKLIIDTK